MLSFPVLSKQPKKPNPNKQTKPTKTKQTNKKNRPPNQLHSSTSLFMEASQITLMQCVYGDALTQIYSSFEKSSLWATTEDFG